MIPVTTTGIRCIWGTEVNNATGMEYESSRESRVFYCQWNNVIFTWPRPYFIIRMFVAYPMLAGTFVNAAELEQESSRYRL